MRFCDICSNADVKTCNGCGADLCNAHDRPHNHQNDCAMVKFEREKMVKEMVLGASLVFEIKKGAEEIDTIIRVAKNKLPSFMARIKYMKRNSESVNLFDLAGNSKRQLQVWRRGEKNAGRD